MTVRQLVGIAFLACTLHAAGGALALTGSGDSPLFSLNTRWVSKTCRIFLPSTDSKAVFRTLSIL